MARWLIMVEIAVDAESPQEAARAVRDLMASTDLPEGAWDVLGPPEPAEM